MSSLPCSQKQCLFESDLYSALGENELMGPLQRSSRMRDAVTKLFSEAS